VTRDNPTGAGQRHSSHAFFKILIQDEHRARRFLRDAV
jgi:hypothetical protein